MPSTVDDEDMTMNCPTCAAELPVAAAFCNVCGTAVGGHAAGVGAGPAGGRPPVGLGAQAPSESRAWAVGAHLSAMGIGLLSAAMLGFLGPLVVWLIRKDEDPFVEHHAKEALNFHLTVLLVLVASVVLAIPAVIVGVLTLGLGLVLLGLAGLVAVILWFVLPIVAAVKASSSEGYRYPLTIRFVR